MTREGAGRREPFVLMLVNGPGELWGWGRPLAAAFETLGVTVQLRLLPCQFAGGEERTLLGRLASVRGEGPEGFLRFLATSGGAPPGAVVQLGGDLWIGRRVARRWGVPLACYTYGPKKGLGECALVATGFPGMASRIAEAGGVVDVVGDLVADALALDQGEDPWGEGEGCRLALFPGSRPTIRRCAQSFLGRFVRSFRDRVGVVTPVAVLSPAVGATEARLWEASGMIPFRGGAGVVLPGAHLALTQPGTNTLELLHCATPGIVAVPDAFLDKVPLGGVLGWAARMPGVGGWLRHRLLARWRGKLLAWPNRLAGRAILPEAVGPVTPEDLAALAAELWERREDRERMQRALRDLRETAGGVGAARRWAAKIVRMAGMR